MNNVTKVIISHFTKNPNLIQLPYSMKEIVYKSILDHSNHLLVLALAAAATEQIDWHALEEAAESIRSRD